MFGAEERNIRQSDGGRSLSQEAECDGCCVYINNTVTAHPYDITDAHDERVVG